ncbi:TetR/AcrR family transcriptional regulator [Streptomyces sp. NPDC059092]|uniref:TetR/AcrR family transcriptional regulator n=1 Tax=Streptomyces sp. NPDC059092 TaxID=3346725 RepID=UPI00369E0660
MPTKEARESYHHGSLREELISACVALIEDEGIGAVSLRRVARQAGVSPRAPYHHFPDRSTLLAAICVQGHELLEPQLRQAREQAPTGARALGAIIHAYVEFARNHPAHMHLMLRSELSEPDKNPEAHNAGAGALRILTEAVEDCQREGSAPPGDPNTLVGMVWALGVGIVTLWLDGPLENRCVQLGTTPEQLTARIAAMLESMMSAGARTAGTDG